MSPWHKSRSLLITCSLLVLALFYLSGCATASMSADLPLPSSMKLNDYERVLYSWLLNQEYKADDWAVDKGVRDTGPFIQERYYGTHPAVRIYYSPEVMAWLQNGREGEIADGGMIIKEMYSPPATFYEELRSDPKYQEDPAAYEAMLGKLVSGWAVIVRDSGASSDGWFWAGVGAAQEGESVETAVERQLDDYSHILYSSFGGPCQRCHASAAKELTFSALKNVEGFFPDDEPIRFRVDNSWRSPDYLSQYPHSLLADDPFAKGIVSVPRQQRPWMDDEVSGLSRYVDAHLRPVDSAASSVSATPLATPDPLFTQTFSQIAPVEQDDVRVFPSQWADHVVPPADGPHEYITSDNCLGCHGGLGGAPSGVTMFVQTGPNYGDGFNLSEYGEWRWSPMGLAGRDPIFHAQLESEMVLLARDGETPGLLSGSVEANQQVVTNTCLSCHGAMGERQLQIDAQSDSSLDPNFDVEYFYLTEALSAADETSEESEQVSAYHKYGALAREGISCLICHRMTAPDAAEVAAWEPSQAGWITDATPKEIAYFLFHDTTGRFESGPANEVYGPFVDVVEQPMENSIGITPKADPFIEDSKMCGACHTINLPNIGLEEDEFPILTAAEQNPALKPYNHTIEQATFLEWQNSAFGPDGDQFRSCQDCHMPGGFESLDGEVAIPQLVTQIAAIQDTSFPDVENGAPADEITVPIRTDYQRHEHVGLNVFLLEMFNQFPAILGVDQTDYMTSATTGNALALENMVRQAQNNTIDLAVEGASVADNTLTANVTITNKSGHRFPSGVAFRRAFLEFLVFDGEEVIWGSGRTDSAGVIVDGEGQPLVTEFLPDENAYQPHYQTITGEDQVQIYEELNQDANRTFTTSFVHRVFAIKDNRLLPLGWRASTHFEVEGAVIQQFMQATDPHAVADDPDYADQGPDFPGQDSLQYIIDLPAGIDPANLSVKATVYYQAIPPYWLHQRFTLAPDGDATKRLYYLTSHLNLEGTVMENWKLPLVSASARVE